MINGLDVNLSMAPIGGSMILDIEVFPMRDGQAKERIRKLRKLQAPDTDQIPSEPKPQGWVLANGQEQNQSSVVNPAALIESDIIHLHGRGKTNLEEWAVMTAWHGVVDFVYARTCVLKLIWVIIVLFGGVMSILQTYALVNDYLEGDKWITTIRYDDPDGELGPIDWPNMTISVINWLNEHSLSDVDIHDPYLAAYILSGDEEAIRIYYRSQHFKNETNSTEMDDQVEQTLVEYRTYIEKHAGARGRDDVLDKLAQTCGETIVHCGKSNMFDLRKNISCCDTSVNATYGLTMNSFKINPTTIFGNRTPLVDKAGYEGGVYFLLDPKVMDDYQIVRMNEKPSIGFYVTLYFGEEPDMGSSSTMLIPAGSHTVISVTAHQYLVDDTAEDFLGWDKMEYNCVRDENYDFKYVNATSYTVNFCREECKAKILYEKFNCTCQRDIKMKDYNMYCRLRNANVLSTCTAAMNTWDWSACTNSCIEPCQFKMVSTERSETGFPAPSKLKSFTTYLNSALGKRNNINYSMEAVVNMTLLEIYYDSNQWMVVEKMPRITTDALIGNIGGVLGIWTGISLISIVQAFIYALFGMKQLMDYFIWYCSDDPVYMPPGTRVHHRGRSDG